MATRYFKHTCRNPAGHTCPAGHPAGHMCPDGVLYVFHDGEQCWERCVVVTCAGEERAPRAAGWTLADSLLMVTTGDAVEITAEEASELRLCATLKSKPSAKLDQITVTYKRPRNPAVDDGYTVHVPSETLAALQFKEITVEQFTAACNKAMRDYRSKH